MPRVIEHSRTTLDLGPSRALDAHASRAFLIIPRMLPATQGAAARLVSLFSAVTSAMQPARLPLCLLAVFLVTAMAPIVDLAAGKFYSARGFAAGAMTDRELEFQRNRARGSAGTVASAQLVERESAGQADDDALEPARELSLSQMQSAVREATAARIAEGHASEGGLDEIAEKRIRRTASDAMRSILDASPRGVATVFLDGQRAASRQTVTGLFRLDPEMFLGGILSAIFTLPAGAIREAPIVFPLALIVLLAAISVIAGGVCRMAAVHAGRDARLSMLEGSGFARARALNLAALPVFPVLVIGAMSLVVVVFALLLRVPVANVLSALLFVIPLLIALLAAILALVTVLGFPLMPAAVAVESCDAGEAITRAAALVLARPLLWLATLAFAVMVLVIGGCVVQGVLLIASGGVDGVMSALGGTAGRVLAGGDAAEIAALVGPDRLVALVVSFWSGIFAAVGAAYMFSLACDLATRSYLAMREKIDGEAPSTMAGYGLR